MRNEKHGVMSLYHDAEIEFDKALSPSLVGYLHFADLLLVLGVDCVQNYFLMCGKITQVEVTILGTVGHFSRILFGPFWEAGLAFP